MAKPNKKIKDDVGDKNVTPREDDDEKMAQTDGSVFFMSDDDDDVTSGNVSSDYSDVEPSEETDNVDSEIETETDAETAIETDVETDAEADTDGSNKSASVTSQKSQKLRVTDEIIRVTRPDDASFAAATANSISESTQQHMQGMLVGLLGATMSSLPPAKQRSSTNSLTRAKVKAMMLASSVQSIVEGHVKDGMHRMVMGATAIPTLGVTFSPIIDARPVQLDTMECTSSCVPAEVTTMSAYLERMHALRSSRDPPKQVALRLMQASAPYVTESQQASPTRTTGDVDCYLACELPHLRAVRALGLDDIRAASQEFSYQGDPVHVVGVVVKLSNAHRKSPNQNDQVEVFDAQAYKSHLSSLKAGDIVNVSFMGVNGNNTLERTPEGGLSATIVTTSQGIRIRIPSEDRVVVLGVDTPPALVYGSSWKGPRLQKDMLPDIIAITGASEFDFIASHILPAMVPTSVETVALTLADLDVGSSSSLGDLITLLSSLVGVSIKDAYEALLRDDALMKYLMTVLSTRQPAKPTTRVKTDMAKSEVNTTQLLLDSISKSEFLGYDRVTTDADFAIVSDSSVARSLFLASKGIYASDAHVLTHLDTMFDDHKSAIMETPIPPIPPIIPGTKTTDDDNVPSACFASIDTAVDSSFIGVTRLLTDFLDPSKKDPVNNCVEMQLAQSHLQCLDAPWTVSKVPSTLSSLAAIAGQDARSWSVDASNIRIIDEAMTRVAQERQRSAMNTSINAAMDAKATLQNMADYVMQASIDREDAKRISMIPPSHWINACAAFLPERRVVSTAEQPNAAAVGVAIMEEALESAFDVDFESLSNYSREAIASSNDESLDLESTPPVSGDPHTGDGTNKIIERFIRAVFVVPGGDFSNIHETFARNIEYYNGQDALAQQTRRQIQLVKLRRVDLQKRVKLSGPKFEAFERELISNMRRRTEALHLLKSVQICGALAIMAAESDKTIQLNDPGITNTSAKAVTEFVLAVSLDEGNIVLENLSGDERTTIADMRKGIMESLEMIRRDKPGGKLIIDVRNAASSLSPSPRSIDLDVEWPGFRPSLDTSRPSSRPEPKGSVHKVLHIIAKRVDDALPLITGVDKKPMRVNACCMQPLTPDYNIHSYLGAVASRRTASLFSNINARKVEFRTMNLARIMVDTKVESDDAPRPNDIEQVDVVDVNVEKSNPKSNPKSNEALEEDSSSNLIKTAREAAISIGGGGVTKPKISALIGDSKDLIGRLAASPPSAAQDIILSEVANALSERFDKMIVDVKADTLFDTNAYDPDGIRAARERFIEVRSTYSDYEDLAGAASQFAGTSLRTLLGRIACNHVNINDIDDDDNKGKTKTKPRMKPKKMSGDAGGIMNGAWQKSQQTCMMQLAQSSTGREFQRRVKDIVTALPPASAYTVHPSAHGGKGLYVTTLLAAYVAFSTVANIVVLGKEIKVPNTALQALVRAVTGLLSEVTALNAVHDDSAFKALTLEQLEASKKRKIDVYAKVVAALDGDRELLREMRKIKDINYDELEDRYAVDDNEDVQQKTSEPSEDDLMPSTSSAVVEEDNYFVFDGAPGRVDDGYDGFDGDDMYDGGKS